VGRVTTFSDKRVERLLKSISAFSYDSMKQALVDYDEHTLRSVLVDREGLVVSWGLLVELNFALMLFQTYDNRFVRANASASEEDVSGLIKTCVASSTLPKRMSIASVSFGEDPHQFRERLDMLLTGVHEKRLSNDEYDWLNTVTESLLGATFAYSLPTFKSAKLPTSSELRDRYATQAYDLKFSDLQALKLVVDKMLGRKGGSFVRIERGLPWVFATQFVLTPDDLFEHTLDELIYKQPTFFAAPRGMFWIHRFIRPIVYVRTLCLEETHRLATQYTNLEGASMEAFILKYLTELITTFDLSRPDFPTSHGKRYEVWSNIVISRAELPQLFILLKDPNKPEIEIDSVVNGAGRSLVVESKYCQHGGTARKYYSTGIGDQSEQSFLQLLVTFLRENQDARRLFHIPPRNEIGGAYVTNRHGSFFAIKDGLFKVSAWEIFLNGYLERLVESHPENFG
jgi:hypothetical protein